MSVSGVHFFTWLTHPLVVTSESNQKISARRSAPFLPSFFISFLSYDGVLYVHGIQPRAAGSSGRGRKKSGYIQSSVRPQGAL
jgi:hypothetical protein